MTELHIRHRKLLYCLSGLGIVLAAGLIYVIFKNNEAQYLQFLDPKHDKSVLMHTFRDRGPKDALLLILLTAITSAVPALSSSVICIFNGVCFGPVIGLLMNITGNSLGNALVAGFFTKFDEEHDFSKETKRPNRILEHLAHFKNKMVALILGYMIPIIPSFLVNYMGVRLKMDFKKQFLCIVIGVLPTSFLYAFGGDAIFKGNDLRLIISTLCIILLVVGGVTFYRKNHDAKKTN